MNNKISLNNLINELKLDSNASPAQIKEIITNLFIHIRINNECGRWVDIQGFGSFHPLWYKIKKYKQIKDNKNIKLYKISSVIILFLVLFSAILFTLDIGTKKELKIYKSFKTIENTQTTTEKYYRHAVKKGDNLYTLSQAFYNDTKFWPLIYTKNNIDDMDKIYPDDILRIPRTLQGSDASKELAKIYIKTYKEYKRLGKDNKAQWLLFWFNNNIDEKFIKKHAKDISDKDKKNLQDYIKRFKPLK